MSRNDDVDFADENTFKVRLRKLYQLVYQEGIKSGVDLHEYEFVGCEGFNEVIDIWYTDGAMDFMMSVKGSEKRGYRILNVSLDETLTEEDYD